MTAEIESIIDTLLREGLDDWLPVDTLLWHVREAFPAPPDRFKNLVPAVLHRLLADRLMVVGDLGESGFEPWEDTPEKTVERVIAGLEALGWEPLGGFCWLADTPQGAQRASGPEPRFKPPAA